MTEEEVLPFIPKLLEIDLKEDKRPLKFRFLFAQTAAIHNAVTYLMAQTDWDFTAVYYRTIDLLGHHFMQYHPPRMPAVSEKDFELYKDIMTGCYRYHDLMLNALLQYAGKDTTGYHC